MNFILASKDSDDINLTSSIEIQKVCEIGLSFISTKQIGKIRFSFDQRKIIYQSKIRSAFFPRYEMFRFHLQGQSYTDNRVDDPKYKYTINCKHIFKKIIKAKPTMAPNP